MTIIFANYNKVPSSRLNPFVSFTSARKEFCCVDCTPELKPKKTVVTKHLPQVSNGGKLTIEVLTPVGPSHNSTCQSCGEYCLNNSQQCRSRVESLKEQKRLTAMRRKMYNRPKKEGKKKLQKERTARGQKKNKWMNSKIKKKMLNKGTGYNFACCGGPWNKVDAARSSRRKKKVKASQWRTTLLDVFPESHASRKLGYALKSDYCDALRRPIYVGF